MSQHDRVDNDPCTYGMLCIAAMTAAGTWMQVLVALHERRRQSPCKGDTAPRQFRAKVRTWRNALQRVRFAVEKVPTYLSEADLRVAVGVESESSTAGSRVRLSEAPNRPMRTQAFLTTDDSESLVRARQELLEGVDRLEQAAESLMEFPEDLHAIEFIHRKTLQFRHELGKCIDKPVEAVFRDGITMLDELIELARFLLRDDED
ncbi:MAG: hypothetical protein AAFX05_00735 [Planctomycetota bacterium]